MYDHDDRLWRLHLNLLLLCGIFHDLTVKTTLRQEIAYSGHDIERIKAKIPSLDKWWNLNITMSKACFKRAISIQEWAATQTAFLLFFKFAHLLHLSKKVAVAAFKKQWYLTPSKLTNQGHHNTSQIWQTLFFPFPCPHRNFHWYPTPHTNTEQT